MSDTHIPESATERLDPKASADFKSVDPKGGVTSGGFNAGEMKQTPLIERRCQEEGAQYRRSIYGLSVSVQVVVGTAKMTIADLLKLDEGSILVLDRAIDEPVELCIEDRVIAKGELIQSPNSPNGIAFKITEIVDVSEDMLQ